MDYNYIMRGMHYVVPFLRVAAQLPSDDQLWLQYHKGPHPSVYKHTQANHKNAINIYHSGANFICQVLACPISKQKFNDVRIIFHCSKMKRSISTLSHNRR